MNDDELQRWACLIDGLVKGDYVELLFPTAYHARRAFADCIGILKSIDLPFEARRHIIDMRVTVCGTIRFLVDSDVRVHYWGGPGEW